MSAPARTTQRVDPLPASSRAKLMRLQGEAADARDAAASASRRMDELRKALDYADGAPADAPGIEIELGRLHAVRDAQDRRHRELSDLVANITNWLASLPRTAAFDAARAVVAKPEAGESLTAAIKRIREEIGATIALLHAIGAAPLPKADLKVKARVYVAGLAARGKPTIRTERNELSISFSDPKAFSAVSSERAVTFLAWLHQDAMAARLEAEIDALPNNPTAMNTATKEKRLADAKANLEMLERKEAALVDGASGAGIDVLHRSDASPLAVLGIVAAKQKVQRTAA